MRTATAQDIEMIRKLSQEVWPKTYASILVPDQILYMMELMYSEDALSKQMNSGHRFLIVYDELSPIGFASYNEIEQSIFKLQKIYILQQYQGRGAGGFVIEKIINEIKNSGATALQLNVNRKNKAKNFYEKIGFNVIRKEQIDIGNGYFMNDYVMEKKIEVL